MQMKNINISQVEQFNCLNNVNDKMTLDETLEIYNRGVDARVETTASSNELNNGVYKPVPPPKPLSPPYRMPPQPPGGLTTPMYGGEPQIPGATAQTELQQTNITLRTHSSKFPIERELILSSDKAATKIPLMHDCRTPSGLRRAAGLQLLPRLPGSVAPDHPPKQMQAWNPQTQSQTPQDLLQQTTLTGAIPRAPARLPEDVTALAERENNSMKERDKDNNKNAVAKTYHTLKDLISSKFKKDINENGDELNNVSVQQQSLQQNQQQQQQSQQQLLMKEQEDFRSPYSALPMHMRQTPTLNQSQPNIWMGRPGAETPRLNGQSQTQQQQQQQQQILQQQQPQIPPQRPPYAQPDPNRSLQSSQPHRAASQPQLNMPFERRGSQVLLDQPDRRGSLANIDVTDSDEGGFASRMRRPQTMYQVPQPSVNNYNQQTQFQQQQQQQQALRNSPHVFLNGQQNIQQTQQQQPQHNLSAAGSQIANHNSYLQQHTHNIQSNQQYSQQNQFISQQSQQQFQQQQHIMMASEITNKQQQQQENAMIQARQDALRASFQKQQQEANAVATSTGTQQNLDPKQRQTSGQELLKQMPGSTASSDYDKSGNQSSNVDSGRGSAAYSSGRKGGAPLDTSPESSDSPTRIKDNDSEWVDIVDAELRHILEPGMQGLSLRPESTVSGSVSSVSPPLPPLSPGGSSRYKPNQSVKETTSKQIEYGMDSYNRASRTTGPIGPSRAGWAGSSLQKHSRPAAKKQEQTLLKRHLFGLDNDLTSTTTRSLDLDSLLGAPWGGGQSVSDSETDTQGLRHIRSQLEGLEHMYGEVLRMLGSRQPPGRINETSLRGASTRRRHGSLSSLPSSSVSGRPIRDRRRTDERRKVRDMKGINKRFQRLESHVVTLARSVAHLSSEMRSQHLVTQELERLRDDLATLRSQAGRPQNIFRNGGVDPEPPNLTNPRRVKKLTKFFGEDPPLMRLFLKKLGYEKYANLFEAERVGMVELPYLGEERLQKLGVPLGPRLRILQEAQISLCKDTTLCIV